MIRKIGSYEEEIMSKKVVLFIIFLFIVSFFFPVRKETKYVSYSQKVSSFGTTTTFYYNIYGQKIWPPVEGN